VVATDQCGGADSLAARGFRGLAVGDHKVAEDSVRPCRLGPCLSSCSWPNHALTVSSGCWPRPFQ
jgi:hypothetical protein